MNRFRASAMGLLFLIFTTGAASRAAIPAAPIPGGSAITSDPLVIAQLTEDNLGPADLSPTPTPTGSSIPSAATASTSITPTPDTESSPAAAPTPEASPGASTPAPLDGQEQQPMTPGAVATPEPPPPLDYANVPPSMPVSDSSLEPLIQKTTEPALGTSLRITEEARRQLASGHPDEAIRTLGRAVSVDASNPYAYFYLGRSYFMKKGYNQALTFFARAEIGMGSDSAWLGETLSFEGACYEELGRTREAADAYRHAIQVAPGNLMARVGYGRLAPELPPPSPAPESSPDIGTLDEPPPVEATPQPAPGIPAPAPAPENSTDD